MAVAVTDPCRVRRPFDMNGRRVVAGEIVDAGSMRNGRQLIQAGYLVRLDETDVTEACPRCGAIGDSPCLTPSGKATKRHSGR